MAFTQTEFHTAFLDLARDLHRRCGESLPEGHVQVGQPAVFALELNEVAFQIGIDPAMDLSSLVVQCTYGRPPEDRKVHALERLLEANLALYRFGGATFGVLQDSKEVVALLRQELAVVTSDSLLSALQMMAEQAREWRTTLFLEVPSPANHGAEAINYS